MPTIILSPLESPDSIAIAQAAKSQNWNVIRLTSWRAPVELASQNPILYGQSLFTIFVAETLALALLEPPIGWAAQLPAEFLKRKLVATTLAEARNVEFPAFIKPAVEKPFLAKVYESSADLPSTQSLPDSYPVFVCEPVNFVVEYRCFILGKEVASLSSYFADGELTLSESGEWIAVPDQLSAAREFCSAFLDQHDQPLPPAFVLDVGLIEDRGWAVIEANPASASGIYGCDPVRILPVIQRACMPLDQLSDDDRQWVIDRPSWDV